MNDPGIAPAVLAAAGGHAPSDDADVVTLRRCVRDLAALAALPAMWSGSAPARIVEGLADAVLGLLQLEFVHIAVVGAGGDKPLEVQRVASRPGGAPRGTTLAALLAPWLAGHPRPPERTRVAWGHADVGVVAVPFGSADARGTLLAGKCTEGFPGDAERLLLRVAANQAAVLLARQLADTERERLLREVQAERAQLAELFETQTRRAALLARVAHATRSMNAVLSVGAIAKALTDEARAIVGAHAALTTVADGACEPTQAASASDAYVAYRAPEAWASMRVPSVSPDTLIAPARWPSGETRSAPSRATAGARKRPAAGRPQAQHAARTAWRGWLAVPLLGHGGRRLGVVQLADKQEGGFTDEDEAILVQLAATAAVGLENARLYDALREQDRRKDEFLATLAHELRNPLAPLRSGLEILRRTGSLDDRALRARDMMERQLRHLVRLVDDLMDVSRVSRGKVTLVSSPFPLARALESALEASRPLIEAGEHTLDVSCPPEPLHVDGDLTRLAQVFGNLLNNAAKYTPPGGRIGVALRREGDDAIVEVSDNGPGIASALLEQVFEPFVQLGRPVDRLHEGLGIGLSLARALIAMHGGSIRAHSAGPGSGATFMVRLPACEAPALEQPPLPDAARRASAERSLRVLVVDDNADAAHSLALLLQLGGHEVRICHAAAEAPAVAAGFGPHAVFLDIGMPGMNGYEVAQRLRSLPATHASLIVAVSGWGTEADRAQARAAGFDVHLTKPADGTSLETALAMALERAMR